MKKFMRKTIAVFIVLLISISCFAACGGNDTEGKATNKPAPSATVKPSATPTTEPTATPESTPTPEPVKVNDLTDGENVKAEANIEQDDYLAELAIDNDDTTRWSGAGDAIDSEWKEITIDLGAEYKIGEISIFWESISNPYKIYYTSDKTGEWKDLMSRPVPADLYEEFLIPATTARYIKLSSSDTGFFSIYEIEIIEHREDMKYEEDTDENVNIALNKTVTTNTRIENDTLGTENATDGDISTRWAPMPGKPEDTIFITVDLGQKYNLSSIEILFESCQSDFIIEVCDTAEGEYKVIEEGLALDSTAEPYVIDAEGESAQFIRYRRQGGVWGSIFEIVVYAA